MNGRCLVWCLPRFPAHYLQRAGKSESLGFEEVVEVPADLTVAAVIVVGVTVLAIT